MLLAVSILMCCLPAAPLSASGFDEEKALTIPMVASLFDGDDGGRQQGQEKSAAEKRELFILIAILLVVNIFIFYLRGRFNRYQEAKRQENKQ